MIKFIMLFVVHYWKILLHCTIIPLTYGLGLEFNYNYNCLLYFKSPTRQAGVVNLDESMHSLWSMMQAIITYFKLCNPHSVFYTKIEIEPLTYQSSVTTRPSCTTPFFVEVSLFLITCFFIEALNHEYFGKAESPTVTKGISPPERHPKISLFLD